MKTIKVSEATGAVLNWLVAKCEGLTFEDDTYILVLNDEGRCLYSTDWAIGGPIIYREGISWHCGNKSNWHAYAYGSADNFSATTPLIAAMRAFAASKMGDTVEVPDELV